MGSFSVNGVAELHSDLLRDSVLRDFYELWPEKFNNKTNGVSPRRFMRLANPRLSDLITSTHRRRLAERSGAPARARTATPSDPAFRQAWREVKAQNKVALAEVIHRSHRRRQVDPDSMFDVMVKRLHEYKRQLLKVLHIITLYNRLKAQPGAGHRAAHLYLWRQGRARLPAWPS